MSVRQLKNIIESEGILIPIEFKDLVFIPKRIFYVTDVPKGEERGKHAHFETMQYLICVQGKLIVKLFDGKITTTHSLIKGQSVFVDKMIWDSQIYLTGNDIMLSVCSTEYNPKDYINNKQEFIKLKHHFS